MGYLNKKNLILVVLLFSQGCKERTSNTRLGISLDSIFINQHIDKEIRGLPYVFFYYDFENKSRDTLILSFKSFDLDKSDNSAFCICDGDSIELFADLAESYTLIPNEKINIKFNISPMYFSDMREVKVDTLTHYAKRCKNVFYIKREKILPSSNYNFYNIIYRNEKDTLGTQIWK